MKFAKTSSVPAITIAIFAGDCDHSDLKSKMSDMSRIGGFAGDLVQAPSVPALKIGVRFSLAIKFTAFVVLKAYVARGFDKPVARLGDNIELYHAFVSVVGHNLILLYVPGIRS